MMEDDSIAGAVITFSRLDYLETCLDSIYNAHGSKHVDWYVYADHPYNEQMGQWMDEYIPSRDIQDQTVELCEEHDLEFEKIVRQQENVDIIGQKHSAHFLFEDYDYVMFFENDLKLGKWYLRDLHSATKQYPLYSPRMYIAKNLPKRSPDELLRDHGPRLWGYELSKEAWERIEDDWNRYYELMSVRPYRVRENHPNREEILDLHPNDCLTHDISLSGLMLKHLEGKLYPALTRGKYIGKEGHYAYNPETWEQKGMDEQPTDLEYDEDPVDDWTIVGE